MHKSRTIAILDFFSLQVFMSLQDTHTQRNIRSTLEQRLVFFQIVFLCSMFKNKILFGHLWKKTDRCNGAKSDVDGKTRGLKT